MTPKETLDKVREHVKNIPLHYSQEAICCTYEHLFPEDSEFCEWYDKLLELLGLPIKG